MPSESIVAQIRARINYEQFFAEFLQLHGRGAERTALCPFHHNTDTPALGINVDDGLFICRNPECGARGDFLDFYQKIRSMEFRDAVAELARRLGIDVDPAPSPDRHVIDEAIVESAHERLLATPSALTFLQERRGLSVESIQRWQLGHDGQRYYIPIRDEAGRCVNIRRYKPGAAGANKMISWRTGFGEARLWPYDSLADARRLGEPVLLTEGEMDCMLACQLGFRAITTTGGAGTWREEWVPLFRGLDVLLCYDADDAGRRGASSIAVHLHGTASRIRIVHIPLAEPPGADFTDYVVGHGHTREDFLRLVGSAIEYAPDPVDRAAPASREPIPLHLSEASKAEYYNAPIRVEVMVSGKTTAPYLIPRTVQVTCGMPGLAMCERCPVASHAGRLAHTLDFESNEILQFIGVHDQTVQKLVKQKIGVPAKCTYAEQEVVESLNVEEIQVIPEIDRSGQDAPYVTRLAYYVGHGVQPNRTYVMTGVTVPTPTKQLATHLIHTAMPSQSNIEMFRLSGDVIQRLRQFQPTRPGAPALWEKLDEVYDDIERHTRIYMRRDLMLAVDLVYHSILNFTLQGEKLVRGWLEALIIGDSRTGKTTVVKRMLDYYRAGEFSSGENTSLAGLIGGLHQIGDSWALQWGKLPLNDRRLVVVDEAGSLPQEQIGRLSGMRSSGIAEIVKVHTERTNARTRQIWISNPRGMKPLSSYSQGVLAVKELIGAPEDIARFDLVVTAASGDVDLAVINAERTQQEAQRFTSELCHQRVMWAWSRSAEQVRWGQAAEQLLLRKATEMGERYKYATEIPIVEPNEQRVKLARLAVAAAATFFSTDESGSLVIVHPEHVEFGCQYLYSLYAKPSLSFTDYADGKRRMNEIADVDEVIAIIGAQPGAQVQLMEQEQFAQRDLAELLGIDDRAELRKTITKLRNAGFLMRPGQSSFYFKTPAAIQLLRRLQHQGTVASTNGRLSRARAAEEELPDEPEF